MASINFGFTPDYTLDMSYTFLMHMLDEYIELNTPEDEKEKKKELSLMDMAVIPGVRIG